MKLYHVFCILLFSIHVQAQQGRSVQFMPTMNGQTLALEQAYYTPTLEDSVLLEVLRFYISNLAFFQEDQLVYALEKQHILLDLASPASLTLQLAIPSHLTFNKIEFNLGIDSLTNVAGAMGGDLDPTLGMYWTWQSGYVNFKLEGVSPKCPARKNRFQFHLGGYQTPYNGLQKVSLAVSQDKNINIGLAIDQWLAAINLQDTYRVMSPNEKSVTLAQNLAALFIPLK